jgi:hypothetical protein
MERGMRAKNWMQVCLYTKRIISAVKRVEFVIDRMIYIVIMSYQFYECSFPNRR